MATTNASHDVSYLTVLRVGSCCSTRTNNNARKHVHRMPHITVKLQCKTQWQPIFYCVLMFVVSAQPHCAAASAFDALVRLRMRFIRSTIHAHSAHASLLCCDVCLCVFVCAHSCSSHHICCFVLLHIVSVSVCWTWKNALKPCDNVLTEFSLRLDLVSFIQTISSFC